MMAHAPVGASYDGSQEVPNFILEMWSDLYTVRTLRCYDDSDVLVQCPRWVISTSRTLSPECWHFVPKYSRDIFDCGGYGIWYLEKGLKNWYDHVYCDWCLGCSIIYFWSGKNSEGLISSSWVSLDCDSVRSLCIQPWGWKIV